MHSLVHVAFVDGGAGFWVGPCLETWTRRIVWKLHSRGWGFLCGVFLCFLLMKVVDVTLSLSVTPSLPPFYSLRVLYKLMELAIQHLLHFERDT